MMCDGPHGHDDEARPDHVDPLRMFDLVHPHNYEATRFDPALWDAAFEEGFRAAAAQVVADRALHINVVALGLFAREVQLDMKQFVAAYSLTSQHRRRRVERLAPLDPEREVYRLAGQFAGECVLLRLVDRQGAEPEGVIRYRLLHREPQFARVGRKVRRILGLTPAEFGERDRQARSADRLRETLDRKARDAATTVIAGLVDDILRRDRQYAVPRSWHERRFLNEELVGRLLVETALFVVERHHVAAFDRCKLQDWAECLEQAICEAAQRDDQVGARDATIPDDDLCPLGGLARTSDSGRRRRETSRRLSSAMPQSCGLGSL